MRYLNKIIFLNSAHVPYAEIKLDGNVHFIGTQGVGKSTLLRAILFFYNADKLRLGIPKEKKGFDTFYFPYDNSYIVYEVMRENGAYSVLVSRSMKRAAYRFIDAPYSRNWFINEQNEVIADWPEIRKRIPIGHHISPIINDYYVFRDIIFGNNKNRDLIPYRKYAIVESPNYQNIPRTIQNVFLNSKLDADFIKDTIIKSMNEDDAAIDLNVYRSLISTFEQEYKDVMLWLKPNKNGVIEVQKQANNVIKRYRQLLYLKQQIQHGHAELNYAEKSTLQYLPVLEEEIKEAQEQVDRYVRLLNEEDDKYKKEYDKLTKEGAIYEDKLKTSKQKRKEYELLNISEIITRVNKEQDISVELESTKQALASLTSMHQNIMNKYEALMRNLDADFKDFERTKKEEALKVKEQYAEEKGILTQNLRKHENAIRDHAEEKRELIHRELLSQTNEISDLRNQLTKTTTTIHFSDEIEQCQSEIDKLQTDDGQLRLNIDQHKLQSNKMRQEVTNEIQQIEWEYKEQIANYKKEEESLETDIQKLNHLLEQQKGSFCEWLDAHKPGWQETIGKVVDEETILYNQELHPTISPNATSDFYGVTIDLSDVNRDLRTPKIIREELEEKNKLCEKKREQQKELNKELFDKSEQIRKKANKQIHDISEEQHLLEAELEQIPSKLKKLKADLLGWKRKDDEWKKEEMNRLNIILGEMENKQRQLNNQLEHVKNDMQKNLMRLQSENQKALKEKEKIMDDAISLLNQQITIRLKELEAQKTELRLSQTNELNGKGADTVVINNYQRKIQEIENELGFIRTHRHYVIEYEKDKREYLDLETEFQERKSEIIRSQGDLKDKYESRANKLKKMKSEANMALKTKQHESETIVRDMDTLKKFREDVYFCPPESVTIEARATKKSCGTLVEELKSFIFRTNKEEEAFKKAVNAFSGNFTSQNTFSFPTNPVTDADYSNYAANVCEFVEEDKIVVYQKRISERYANIIWRISKEMGDLTKNESEIHKTVNAINHDFEERNFTGVIRSIELRAQPSNDKLMQLLLEMKKFNEENQFNMGQVDLFSQESRTDVNEKAVRYLNSFSMKLNDEPGRKFLVLSDTFNLQFRIVENDNDTGWIEKIANVGSDGTDILVKAMVNIMLINVFKEKASRKFGDFKIHCMMDEIGKLHPNNVKGILSFANCRNILLINSSPTTYNVEDYRYTYLLSKDSDSNTKVVPLLTRKQ